MWGNLISFRFSTPWKTWKQKSFVLTDDFCRHHTFLTCTAFCSRISHSPQFGQGWGFSLMKYRQTAHSRKHYRKLGNRAHSLHRSVRCLAGRSIGSIHFRGPRRRRPTSTVRLWRFWRPSFPLPWLMGAGAVLVWRETHEIMKWQSHVILDSPIWKSAQCFAQLHIAPYYPPILSKRHVFRL